MRTPEQIITDLRKAKEEEKAATATVQRLAEELNDVRDYIEKFIAEATGTVE